MSSVREIEWEACLFEPRPAPQYEERFRRETGRPGGMMRFFDGCDWLSDAVVRFSVQLNTHVGIDPDLADQAGLVVSQDNSCRFCFGAQRAFLRVLGMSEAHILRLEQNLLIGELTPRDRAALDYARRLSRSRPLASTADLDALHEAGFSGMEVAELSGNIALHLFFNRLSTFVALAPEQMESFPDAWWVRLFLPLVRARFRRIRRNARPMTLAPAQRQGPFSEIVNALDGLPMAEELRQVLNRVFESDTLSVRSAPLTFAVVSRALGCPTCEQEATRLLAERGFRNEQTEAVLRHLSTDDLSEIERLVASFARESVWYQPAPIQRRCQELRRLLDREQLLELLGVVSLANSICRLGVMTGACQ